MRPEGSPLLPRPGSSTVRARRCSASPWETRWGHGRIHDAGPDPGPVRGPAGDRRGGWLKLSPGQVTDDTDMTLCVARGSSDRADGISRRSRTGSPVGCRGTRRRGGHLPSRDRGVHRKRTARSAPRRAGAGNGAAMRVAPSRSTRSGTRSSSPASLSSRRISPTTTRSPTRRACRWER